MNQKQTAKDMIKYMESTVAKGEFEKFVDLKLEVCAF